MSDSKSTSTADSEINDPTYVPEEKPTYNKIGVPVKMPGTYLEWQGDSMSAYKDCFNEYGNLKVDDIISRYPSISINHKSHYIIFRKGPVAAKMTSKGGGLRCVIHRIVTSSGRLENDIFKDSKIITDAIEAVAFERATNKVENDSDSDSDVPPKRKKSRTVYKEIFTSSDVQDLPMTIKCLKMEHDALCNFKSTYGNDKIKQFLDPFIRYSLIDKMGIYKIAMNTALNPSQETHINTVAYHTTYGTTLDVVGEPDIIVFLTEGSGEEMQLGRPVMLFEGKSKSDVDKGVKGEGQLVMGMLVAFVKWECEAKLTGILLTPSEVNVYTIYREGRSVVVQHMCKKKHTATNILELLDLIEWIRNAVDVEQ